MRAEVALVAVLLSGCSVVSMERLGGGYRREATPRCSTNSAPVALDGIIAAGYGALSVGMAVAQDQDEAAGAAAAVVALASAVYGWQESARCRRAFADHAQFLEFETRMREPMGAPGAEPAAP